VARIDDGHPHVRGDLLDEVAQLRVVEPLGAEEQAGLVGVAREVDERLGTASGGLHRLDGRPQLLEPGEQRVTLGLEHQGGIRVGDPSELLEHTGDGLRVGRRVTQRHPARSSVIRADEESDPLERRGRSGPGEGGRDDEGGEGVHGCSFLRQREYCSQAAGRASG